MKLKDSLKEKIVETANDLLSVGSGVDAYDVYGAIDTSEFPSTDYKEIIKMIATTIKQAHSKGLIKADVTVVTTVVYHKPLN